MIPPTRNFDQALSLPALDGSFFAADWPAPANVRTLITTRRGGHSKGAYDSLNVGAHVGDDPAAVAANRALVQAQIALPVAYLNQVHGNTAVAAASSLKTPADCLPVLFCDHAGTVVAAAHAGWRGLAGGVLENTIDAMGVPPLEIMAWLGPAIGPEAFEVGEDVREAFCRNLSAAEAAFHAIGGGKYLADIYALAKLVLRRAGISRMYGGEHCTVLEREYFFSYRRDGQTGRMLSAVWLQQAA